MRRRRQRQRLQDDAVYRCVPPTTPPERPPSGRDRPPLRGRSLSHAIPALAAAAASERIPGSGLVPGRAHHCEPDRDAVGGESCGQLSRPGTQAAGELPNSSRVVTGRCPRTASATLPARSRSPSSAPVCRRTAARGHDGTPAHDHRKSCRRAGRALITAGHGADVDLESAGAAPKRVG